jgi:hypothetical protein
MRKLILTLAILMAIVGLSLTPNNTNPVTPTGECFGCSDAGQEACVAGAQSHENVCLAAGGSSAYCYQSKLNFLNRCIYTCVVENL